MDFYRKYSYLPPPIPKHEDDRSLVLDKYLSQREGRLAQLDEVAQLAAEVLNATILFSCVTADSISLMGYGTNDPTDETPWESLVKAAPAQISTCRHSILGHDDSPLVLRNKDWRVAKNPLFTSAGGNGKPTRLSDSWCVEEC